MKKRRTRAKKADTSTVDSTVLDVDIEESERPVKKGRARKVKSDPADEVTSKAASVDSEVDIKIPHVKRRIRKPKDETSLSQPKRSRRAKVAELGAGQLCGLVGIVQR